MFSKELKSQIVDLRNENQKYMEVNA